MEEINVEKYFIRGMIDNVRFNESYSVTCDIEKYQLCSKLCYMNFEKDEFCMDDNCVVKDLRCLLK